MVRWVKNPIAVVLVNTEAQRFDPQHTAPMRWVKRIQRCPSCSVGHFKKEKKKEKPAWVLNLSPRLSSLIQV